MARMALRQQGVTDGEMGAAAIALLPELPLMRRWGFPDRLYPPPWLEN